jgi:hypothetical protein
MAKTLMMKRAVHSRGDYCLAIARLLLVALVLGLALLAGLRAAGAALREDDPEQALRLNANDALALVFSMDRRLVQLGGVAHDPAALTATARRALKSEPLSPSALRQIGLAADAANDHNRARDLMQISNRVSRRDLGAHAWMIADRAAAGDIAGVLDHYDLALSTDDRAAALLLPALSAALVDPQIRSALLPFIGKARPWMAGFLGYAIANNARPQDLADLVMARGGLPGEPGYGARETQLLKQLVAKAQYAAAYRYGHSLRGGRASALSEAGFTEQTMDPALVPLTWQLTDQPEVRARRDDASRLAVLAASNARGVAASRVLFLRPGAYQFTQAIAPLPQTEPAPLTWELHCLPSGPSDLIWRQVVPASQSATRYRSAIIIPAQCQAQKLSLIITGRDLQSESGVRLGPVTLEPAVTQ